MKNRPKGWSKVDTRKLRRLLKAVKDVLSVGVCFSQHDQEGGPDFCLNDSLAGQELKESLKDFRKKAR